MSTNANPKEISINFIDFAISLARWKRFIILNTLAISIVVAVITLLLPKSYVSETTLMPPALGDNDLSSIMKGMPIKDLLGGIGGGSSLGGTSMTDVYKAILDSRQLRLKMIDSFNLIHVYKFDKMKKYYIETVLEALAKHVGTFETDYGTLVISAEDKNPERAKQMADFMVAQLDEIYKNLKVQTAANRKQFLEERLALIQQEMAISEDSLTAFQKRNGAVVFDEQAKATIDVASGIEADYMATELSLNLAKDIYPAESASLLDLKRRLNALSAQRNQLIDERISKFMIPLSEMPVVGLEMLKLKRNVMIYEKIYEFLRQQYEQAKIEESKNTPVVQVLDKALVPQKKAKPKRTKIVLMTFAIAFFGSVLLTKVIDAFLSMKSIQAEEYLKIKILLDLLWSRKNS